MIELERKWEDEKVTAKRVTNDSLICKNCIYRFDDSKFFGNTTKCEAYERKPNEVFTKKMCEKYQKEVG